MHSGWLLPLLVALPLLAGCVAEESPTASVERPVTLAIENHSDRIIVADVRFFDAQGMLLRAERVTASEQNIGFATLTLDASRAHHAVMEAYAYDNPGAILTHSALLDLDACPDGTVLVFTLAGTDQPRAETVRSTCNT